VLVQVDLLERQRGLRASRGRFVPVEAQGQRAVRYDIAFIIETARTRPAKLGRPFTCWSVRKLADHLATRSERKIRIGRERLRQLLHAHGVTFQRTRTWKTSNDPDFEVKLDRIEQVTARFPDRCFAFDQFGPLSIRPCHGAGWAERGRPDRLPGTYRRTHGVRYFHGCYSLGDDPCGASPAAAKAAPTPWPR
jgi:hypothetical protein